nr:plasmid pRiA4b ORF-3 family protein [Occultella kanbiaonis]
MLEVEAVLDDPPAQVRCTAGRLACPPEDCGGIWRYTELADWVRGGSAPGAVPEPFDDAEHARDWLPPGWDPDRFDLSETNAVLTAALAPPVPFPDEVGTLRAALASRGDMGLTQLLAQVATYPTAEVSEADATRMLEPYTVLLDAVGDGVRLTSAGFLPPAVVEEVTAGTGARAWWIGKANREDLTWPVAQLRASARALGLVSVRNGRLVPTAAVRRLRDRPLGLWRHVVSRLPLGKSEFDHDAGWLTLAVVGSGVPVENWDAEVSRPLSGLGWRHYAGPYEPVIGSDNPTVVALDLFAGRLRHRTPTGVDEAVAATARGALGLE